MLELVTRGFSEDRRKLMINLFSNGKVSTSREENITKFTEPTLVIDMTRILRCY